MIRKVVTIIILLLFFSISLNGTDGRIKLKNRIIPLYITNINFYYYGDISPTPAVVLSFKEQRHKFMKYSFDEVRKIEFVKAVGEKNFAPVYYIRVWLRRGGHFLHGYMLPITKIEGYQYRRKWKFKLEYHSSYEQNIFNIKEINFVHKFEE